MLYSMRVKNLINQRLKERQTSPKWFKTSYPAQINFIKDPARFKTGLCTRRAGKSYGGGLYLFKEAYENPGVTVMYIAKTIDTAKNIMWKDILKVIDKQFNLGANFIDRKNRVVLPNGSEILLFGADASHDEMEKLRGMKIKLVVIDEGSTYKINLHSLIYKVLKAAVWDYRGTIAMIGTPTDFIQSFFARATMGKVKGWVNHFWTAEDNPHIREQYLKEYDEAVADNPDVESEAWFQQEYMGKWVVSAKNRVFTYIDDPHISESPENLSLNLGIKVDYTKDVTGFAIAGYTSTSREAFIVKTLSLESTDISDIASTLEKLNTQYEFDSTVLVGMTKELIGFLRQRYPVSVPDETYKDEVAIIRLYQSDMLQNLIKVLPDSADIVKEWDAIVKDTSPKFQLHPTCSTHLTIASLYAWINCYNYTYEVQQESDDPNDEYWEREAERITNGGTAGELFTGDEEISGDFPDNWWR